MLFYFHRHSSDKIYSLKLYHLLMPIPSASSKIFWPCSNFFDCVQYFLNTFKFFWPWSKVIFYLINLHIWSWSKIFDHIQIYWMWSKNFERSQFCFWTSRWIRHEWFSTFCTVVHNNCDWILGVNVLTRQRPISHTNYYDYRPYNHSNWYSALFHGT